MSEYCDIFPEDPTCAVEEEEEVVIEETNVDEEGSGDVEGDDEEVDAEEGDAEGKDEMMEEMEEEMMEKMDKMDWDMTPSQMWMKAGDLMRFASIDPFMGEITYLMVAIGVATHTALDLFRYEKTAVLDTYATNKTNWFKIGSLVRKYTYLAVFGLAAVTQILAGFGIAPGINMMVWWFGVMMAGSLASSLGALFKFIGYEMGYKDCATTDATCLADAALKWPISGKIRTSMVEDAIFDTSFMLALYMQGENWMWAQWDAATQEEKETKLEELMAEIEEWDAEKMAEMEGEEKEEKSEDEEDAGEDAEEVDAEEDAEEEVADEEAAEEEE